MCKQKTETTESHARNHIYVKTKIKEERIAGRKDREKRYVWIAIYFEEIIH